MRPVFEDRIISRRADVVWPPRSCDLTLLDYYWWGAVKDKCYAKKLEEALKHNIPEAIGEIQLHTIDNVLKNWTDRGQPKQPFELSYLSLLTVKIVLSNKKKRNLRKYSIVFFKAFSKKKLFVGLCTFVLTFRVDSIQISNYDFFP